MNNKIFIIIIAVIVILFLSFVIFSDNQVSDNQENSQRSNNTYGNSPQEVILEEAYSLGCPACAAHHPILKEIREEFKDQLVFKPVHFPLTASFRNALAAHRAVEAARQQSPELFWQLHDKLFEEREVWVDLDNPIQQIRVFAEEVGVDLDQFDIDFRSGKVNDIINADVKYLTDLGVDGTPAFILNGQILDEADDKAFAHIETAREFLNQYFENLENSNQVNGQNSETAPVEEEIGTEDPVVETEAENE